MKKYIERKIIKIENKYSSTTKWFAIFFNPFFISRYYIYKNIKSFALRNNLHDKKILDIGCGTKPYKELFQESIYIGIDIEGGRLSDNNKKADLFFDGENIPFKDKEFDIAISTEVFEHVENLDKLLKDIHRVLKKDGILFLTMPFVWPEHEKPYDFRRFTSFKHQRILKKHNFQNIHIQSTTGIFATCGQVISDFLLDFFTNKVINKISSRGLGHKLKFVSKRAFIILLCFPVQLIALIFDKIFKHQGLTLDYVVEAQKI